MAGLLDNAQKQLPAT